MLSATFTHATRKPHSIMLQAGDRAPDFAVATQDGKFVHLTDFLGRKLVLYFYPKDATPVCTIQACNLRDNMRSLSAYGITVLGVSCDSVVSHQKFAAKHNLPFLLLADTDRKMVQDYGVWGEKKMFGKTFMGIKRTTFLIGEDGVIHHVLRRPKSRTHAEEVLKAFGL